MSFSLNLLAAIVQSIDRGAGQHSSPAVDMQSVMSLLRLLEKLR